LDRADGVSGSVVLADGQRLFGQALDGKTVCGASRHGPVVHLVSVVRHESGAVLAQQPVATKMSVKRLKPCSLAPSCPTV
jgi:hypothetical protein